MVSHCGGGVWSGTRPWGQPARADLLQAKMDSQIIGLNYSVGAGATKIPLPLAANVTGQGRIQGFAGLATPFDSGVVKGNIVTVGPPLAYGSVPIGPSASIASLAGLVYGKATAYSKTFATPSADGKSVIATPTTSALAMAPPFGTAVPVAASAVSESDPFILSPLASEMPMTIEVNLNPDTADDPTNAFDIQAVSPDNSQWTASSSS